MNKKFKFAILLGAYQLDSGSIYNTVLHVKIEGDFLAMHLTGCIHCLLEYWHCIFQDTTNGSKNFLKFLDSVTLN